MVHNTSYMVYGIYLGLEVVTMFELWAPSMDYDGTWSLLVWGPH